MYVRVWDIGSHIVLKHCEWSPTSYLGLVVKAQEVRRFGATRAKENGDIPRLARLLQAPGGPWRFSSFLDLFFCTYFLDIASNGGHGTCSNS